jgi:hypothetical protein
MCRALGTFHSVPHPNASHHALHLNPRGAPSPADSSDQPSQIEARRRS